MSREAHRAVWRLWGWPAAIAALSMTGLASALMWDGWGDAWSWIALGTPALVGAWPLLKKSTFK